MTIRMLRIENDSANLMQKENFCFFIVFYRSLLELSYLISISFERKPRATDILTYHNPSLLVIIVNQ